MFHYCYSQLLARAYLRNRTYVEDFEDTTEISKNRTSWPYKNLNFGKMRRKGGLSRDGHKCANITFTCETLSIALENTSRATHSSHGYYIITDCKSQSHSHILSDGSNDTSLYEFLVYFIFRCCVLELLKLQTDYNRSHCYALGYTMFFVWP